MLRTTALSFPSVTKSCLLFYQWITWDLGYEWCQRPWWKSRVPKSQVSAFFPLNSLPLYTETIHSILSLQNIQIYIFCFNFFFLQGPQSATMHSLYNPYYPHFCFTQLLFLTYKSSIEANFLLMKSISKSSPNSKTLLTELFRRGIANIQV